jgi:transposase
MNVGVIGLDIAKNVFQVHGEDAEGGVVVQKRLGRKGMIEFFSKLPPCVVALEACGASHYWGRTLRALGHDVRLIPAACVKPFVKRNKTDARDAAAICVAALRPDMREVAIKSEEQQASRALERSGELLVKQRTQAMNSLRAMLAEFGVAAPQGARGFAELTARLTSDDPGLPETLVGALRVVLAQLDTLTPAIAALENRIKAVVKADPDMRRLARVPSVGFLTAHAVVAAIGDGRRFACGRDFTAWMGHNAAREFLRRQAANKGPQPAGGKPAAQAVRLGAVTLLRNARSRADRATQWQRHSRQAADEGGGDGAGRQDRQDRLGGPRLGQGLRAARGGGLSERRIPSSFD